MWRFPYFKHRRQQLILFAGDALLIVLSLALAISFKKSQSVWGLEWDLGRIFWSYLLLGGWSLLSFYIIGIYNPENWRRPILVLLNISLSMAGLLIMYGTLAYFIQYLRAGKALLFIFVGLSISLTSGWHYLIATCFRQRPQRLMFIGHDPILDEIAQFINEGMPYSYTIVKHYHRENVNPTIPNLASLSAGNDIDLIVYSLKSKILKRTADTLLNLRFKKINIYDAPSFYQRLTGKLPIYHLDDFWMLVNSQRDIFVPRLKANVKRVFDIFLASICLPVALPIIVICVLLIKLESKGPGYFIQERLGLNEVPFKLIKIRTMIEEAEASGPQWCKDDDPRITSIGKILRKLRLDELPQLINVLKGDMSFVGPRPIRKYAADMLAEEIPYFRLRFLTSPGITGWAQVSHGYANNVEGFSQMLQYDLFYIVNQSLWLDLFILLKTIRVMVWREGR
jgi:exopolysaccharide biosynthesis polyprenyl glycosylphosphotransferase